VYKECLRVVRLTPLDNFNRCVFTFRVGPITARNSTRVREKLETPSTYDREGAFTVRYYTYRLSDKATDSIPVESLLARSTINHFISCYIVHMWF
jgi:hypothetical protein